MAFNFKQALKQAQDETANTNLGAIVLGSSGAGKSSLMGTFGVKTLFLHTSSGESHGKDSAKRLGGANVVPIFFDKEGKENLSPDATYSKLLDILRAKEDILGNGFEAIAIDGASEIEFVIRQTKQWQQLCLSGQGKHNSFAEPAATLTLLRPIIVALKDLGIHYAMSCILDVKELGPNSEIVEATPRLSGYSVAESLVQQFGDVLVVGRMARAGLVKHKIQMMSDITKTSKDSTGEVKKTVNFAPRIAGLLVTELPPLMDADLSQVIKLKQEKLK